MENKLYKTLQECEIALKSAITLCLVVVMARAWFFCHGHAQDVSRSVKNLIWHLKIQSKAIKGRNRAASAAKN